MIVIDASVAVTWVYDDESDARADAALREVIESVGLVPQHWHLEVRNALLIGERRGRITPDEVRERLSGLDELSLRTDTEPDLREALALARSHNLSFYDAIYLELAQRRQAALATLDSRLSRAALAEGLQTLP